MSRILARNLSTTSLTSLRDEVTSISKVLVLYTGGTIGMMKNERGDFTPEPNFLFYALKQRFEDSDYTYRYLSEEEQRDSFLLHPMENGRRIQVKFVEYDPLIDSSNMCCNNWIQIAKDIKKEYDQFDGFVVLHGTDTMAYTASALAFICHNLGKPIILTGSQIPVIELRSDGYVNFISSLVVACSCIPEVMLCFDAKVFRGCRAIKIDTGAFDAFDSPNMAPLVKLGFKIQVNSTAVQRPKKLEKFFVNTKLCPDVAVLHLLPSMSIATVKSILNSEIKGLIIQTFGAGNAPSKNTEFIKLLKEASERGLVIVNVTQCHKGSVARYYAVAEGIQEAKVVSSGDMTLEAAITKLMFLLGQEELSVEEKRTLMNKNLRGEITIVQKDESALSLEIIEKLADTLNLSTFEETNKLRDMIFPNLMCGAAKMGELETLKKLKDKGGNLSSANQDGRTPLHFAAREGLVSVVKYLLEEGASVHQCDSNNNTPLMDAIYGNRFDVIPLLVRTGATIHIRNSVRIATELCCAADLDDVDTIHSWHIAGADLNCSDYDKRTALHVAMNSKRENAIKYLLNNGADPDAKDQSGKTPRDYAKKNGILHLLN